MIELKKHLRNQLVLFLMASTTSPPLYDRIAHKSPILRALEITILLLLASAVTYRILYFNNQGCAWLIALLYESWLIFNWVLSINTKWNPVKYRTHPEILSQRVEELPPVDLFVTTADPVLEPPIITCNTVISLLALDYPADKLACYVSDDGCSPLTYYSLVEASKFAKLWVPFCKKYNVQVRAPFRYFSSDFKSSGHYSSLEFQQEYQLLKDAYEKLSHKIEEVADNSKMCDVTSEVEVFCHMDRKNHPTIIQVIQEKNEELPLLVYVSREKRPKHPHHYKAGAMNVLIRVSGTLSNAPFMLNVDCDMYVNNPLIVRHAMCLILGSKNEGDSAFVQFPQVYYDGLKDDPYGNQYVAFHEHVFPGFVGLQGPFYLGTGNFQRRKAIYGLCPDHIGYQVKHLTSIHGNLDDKELLNIFGKSKEFIESASIALQGKTTKSEKSIFSLAEAAHQVAACDYEYGTQWGTKIGLQYGSATEDVLTGLLIHERGWKSKYCSPNPPAFLGCSPTSGPASMGQQKRWAIGWLEILFSGRRSPLRTVFTSRLQVRQCLAYSWLCMKPSRSVPDMLYMALPAYCIITNSSFLPKDQVIWIYVALISSYNLYTMLEYFQIGLSIREWWNNQRMERIITINARTFAALSFILKFLGISETVFEITPKKDSKPTNDDHDEAGRFTFDGSPIFIPGTTLLLLHLTALIMKLLGLQHSVNGGNGSAIAEILCSVLVIICFWPFVRGLFGKGKYGIPLSTILKSGVFVLLFVSLCKV